MTREMFQHTSDMALANGVTDGETWPYISLGAGYRRCLVSVPDAPDGNATVPCKTQDNDVFGQVRAPTACDLSRESGLGLGLLRARPVCETALLRFGALGDDLSLLGWGCVFTLMPMACAGSCTTSVGSTTRPTPRSSA